MTVRWSSDRDRGADTDLVMVHADRRRWVLVAGAMLVGLAATALAARYAGDSGKALGTAVTGMSAFTAGCAIGRSTWRRRRARGEAVRGLVAAAFAMWGLGQMLLALDAGVEGWAFDTGYVCGTTAGALVVVAVVAMPRRSRSSRPALRLALDALLLALSALTAVWWGLLRPALPDPGSIGAGAVAMIVMAFFDLMVASLMSLCWLRDRREGALALGLGGILQAAADIHSMTAVLNHQMFPWASDRLWVVAFPLLALGMVQLRVAPAPAEPESVLDDLGESRTTTTVTIIGVGTLTWLLVAPGDHPATDVGAVLLAAVVSLLVVRELLGHRIRNRLVNQLGEEALRDALTGLPNRLGLTHRIQELDLSVPWSLLTVDLDDFKEINELLGDAAGDELIAAVGGLIAANVPDGALVARTGGDEFGVLVQGDVPAGEQVASALARAVRLTLGHQAGVPLSVSVGVGRVLPEAPAAGPTEPDADDAVPALLDPRHDRLVALMEATTALQAAKAEGRDRVAVYPGAVENARERRLVIEWRLRRALTEGRLQMHAQPLVDLRSGEVRGFESLARWTDDLLGPVSPAEFVTVAEQVGLVTQLGDFALRATLEDARVGGLFGGPVEIGVNVSPIQLRLPGFAPMVVDLVSELGLPPNQLMIEVTEAILIDEDDPANAALAQLGAAGIRLAIDDFGTGYSALGYLRRFPVDILKIDRSWVVDAFTDQRTRHIVASVVDMAHHLGAAVVMEGIEDDEVAAMCLEVGADIGQGWHFGRPKPWADAVREFTQVRRPA
jgi:diguanylate cyclase (GGDEF)-like protein